MRCLKMLPVSIGGALDSGGGYLVIAPWCRPGPEHLLRVLGRSFAGHARYASRPLQRGTDAATAARIRAAVDELTARAVAAGTIAPGVTASDITALV